MNSASNPTPLWRKIWRVIIGLAGTLVLLVGFAMIVLPGPAFILIPLGLAILALEFAWAGRLLKRMKDWIKKRRERPPKTG